MGATEGINVLVEKQNNDGKWAYGLSCIEYTEFDKFGIADGPLSPNRYILVHFYILCNQVRIHKIRGLSVKNCSMSTKYKKLISYGIVNFCVYDFDYMVLTSYKLYRHYLPSVFCCLQFSCNGVHVVSSNLFGLRFGVGGILVLFFRFIKL